jgi:predicted hydrolase (HD superfamily)
LGHRKFSAISRPSTIVLPEKEELGVPLDEHIDFCVKAMQARAEELGLKGSASLP